MKNQPIIVSVKVKPILVLILAFIVLPLGNLFGQDAPPPDGDGSTLAPATSDPTPVTAPILVPSSQVIIIGGSTPTIAPVTSPPPIINTTVITPVQISPSSVIITGGNPSGPGTATNSPGGEAPLPQYSEPVVIGSRTKPVFRPAVMPVRRQMQIVRPAPPLLKPMR